MWVDRNENDRLKFVRNQTARSFRPNTSPKLSSKLHFTIFGICSTLKPCESLVSTVCAWANFPQFFQYIDSDVSAMGAVLLCFLVSPLLLLFVSPWRNFAFPEEGAINAQLSARQSIIK